MMRRTPMKRTAFRAKPSDTLPAKAMKTCEVCGTEFEKRSMGHRVCKPACAEKLVKRDTASRKEAVKTLADWKREAQTAFNAYIRFRDKDKTCISSGKPLAQEAIGGGFDAGHYRSIGSAPHLRFNENNVHGQCKQDNRYGAGRAVEYRIGLIARIGFEAVEALESDNAYHKWTIEELKAIKTLYKAKLKDMQKNA